MRRFQNVLLVATGDREDRPALRSAVELAVRHGAVLTVAAPVGTMPRVGLVDVEAMTRDFVERKVRRELRRAAGGRLRVPIETLFGDPSTEIVARVAAGRHDLVVKAVGSGGGGPLGRLDRKLLRSCPCPVWLVREGRKRRYFRVAAAVAPLHPDALHRELDHTVMHLAASIADERQGELHVLTAWTVEGESTLGGAFAALPPPELEAIRRAHEEATRTRLDTLAGQYPSPGARRKVLHLEHGNAIDVLRERVAREKIDLVVLGTVGRRGIAGLVVGNTAERVLDAVACSVLVVKAASIEERARLTA